MNIRVMGNICPKWPAVDLLRRSLGRTEFGSCLGVISYYSGGRRDDNIIEAEGLDQNDDWHCLMA